jgi:hypothetical protein
MKHPVAISQVIPTMGCLLEEAEMVVMVEVEVVTAAPRPGQVLRPNRISNSRSKNSKSQGLALHPPSAGRCLSR